MNLIKVKLFDQEIPIYPRSLGLNPYKMDCCKKYISPFRCEIRLIGIDDENRCSSNEFGISKVQIRIMFLELNNRIEFEIQFQRFMSYHRDNLLERLIVNSIFEQFHQDAINKLNIK